LTPARFEHQTFAQRVVFRSGAAASVVAAALGEPDAVNGLLRLSDALGAPRSLRELGMPADRLPEAIQLVLAAAPASNPRAVTADGIGQLLRRAWSGDPPTTAEDHEGER
jgi:maleylacetate reductase